MAALVLYQNAGRSECVCFASNIVLFVWHVVLFCMVFRIIFPVVHGV